MNRRTTATMAVVAVLATGITACGADDSETDAAVTAKPTPVAQIDQLSGRTTAVALDPGFVSALKSLKLTPSPLGSASISKGGTASFPISGGNVTYYKPGSVSPYVQGEIDHKGGLSLEGAGKTVNLRDFVIDPGKSVLTGTVAVNGKVAAKDAPLFFLDGRTLQPLKANDNGTAVLQGTTVKLKAEAAGLLNRTFGVDALKEGLKIGVAKITVNTK
jgi:hypothetical protein